MKRSAGVLMPIFSLSSPFGIGTFSKEAYAFIDFLKAAGQGYWQILPIGPTGFGDSPYQSVSTFAGNPYFIDPVTLKEQGLLSEEELWTYDFGGIMEQVDYGKMYQFRYLLLKHAYDRFVEQGGLTQDEYNEFKTKEAEWLDDYALFMAIKRREDGKSWLDWPTELKSRQEEALLTARAELEELVEFYCFQQFEFYKQWNKLHAYAKEKGIQIIGDIPFFVSLDSCDVWSHPEAFEMSEDHTPKAVAGTADGQVWGNPVYNWKEMEQDGYSFWMHRMRHANAMYDVLRLDHFHGFLSCFAIPYGETAAEHGTMEPGPGLAFFEAVRAKLGDVKMIAEDLGELTSENQ